MNDAAPTSAELSCNRCKRPLISGEERRVPVLFKFPAALALGPFHAGMWMWQELSLPYCSRCRGWISFLCVVLAATVLSLAAIAFRWAYIKFEIK